MSRLFALVAVVCVVNHTAADNIHWSNASVGRSNFAYCPSYFGGATTVHTYGGLANGGFGYAWQSYGPFFTESSSYYGPGFGYNYSAWWTHPIDRVGYVGSGYWPIFDHGYLASDRSNGNRHHHELAPGTAQIRFDVPAFATVTTQAGAVEPHGSARYFITPVLKGPTTFEFKVTKNGADQVVKVNVQPGDKRQVVMWK